jgi:hypothetical protein
MVGRFRLAGRRAAGRTAATPSRADQPTVARAQEFRGAAPVLCKTPMGACHNSTMGNLARRWSAIRRAPLRSGASINGRHALPDVARAMKMAGL